MALIKIATPGTEVVCPWFFRSIASSATGERGADIAYPSLDCGGVFVRRAAPGPSLVFQEVLNRGLDRCLDGGTVTLSYDADADAVRFEYQHEGSGVNAWGSLRREP